MEELIKQLNSIDVNDKGNYPEIVSVSKALAKEFGNDPVALAAIKEVYSKMSEMIFEYYIEMEKIIFAYENALKVTDDVTFESVATGNLKIKEIYVSQTAVTIEIADFGKYFTDEPCDIVVNGELYAETNKVINTICNLLPDTEVDILVSSKVSDKSGKIVFKTRPESFCLNVKDFGAKGDGISDDTVFIQCAINACPENGRVFVPAGKYCVTTIFLKSNLNLEISEGAEICQIPEINRLPMLPGRIIKNDPEKYVNYGSWEGNPLTCFAAVITGIGVNNVNIYGKGTINGSATHDNWWKDPKNKHLAWRPRLFFINSCKNVSLVGVTLKNSPSWNIHPYFSDDLKFIDLEVLNPSDSPNTDGLDPESCKNVDIIGVHFSLGDDCIAIKSGKIYMGKRYKQPSENINIYQCFMENGHGSVTMGSECAGGIKNVKVSNCRFRNTDRGLRIKTRRGRGKDAIIDNIEFTNIDMDGVMAPVTINAFYFCDPDGHSDYVQNKAEFPVDDRTPVLGRFNFNNIEAKNCHAACAYILGLPEKKVTEVVFENINFTFAENPKPMRPVMMDGIGEVTKVGIFAENIDKLKIKNCTIDGRAIEE